jgi:hypothetical protein
MKPSHSGSMSGDFWLRLALRAVATKARNTTNRNISLLTFDLEISRASGFIAEFYQNK